MTRVSLDRFVVFLLGITLAGCMDDEVVGSSTVNGTYTLRTMNGNALPFTVSSSATETRETLDDRFSLYQGGTYARTRHTRVTVNRVATTITYDETGTHSPYGTSITFTSSDRTVTTLSIYTANTLTIVTDGITAVYRK